MLHSLHALESCDFNGGMDMSVLEKRQARFKWLQQQNNVIQSCPVDLCTNSTPLIQGLNLFRNSSILKDIVQMKEPELYLGASEFPNFGNLSASGAEEFTASDITYMPAVPAALDHCISRTSSHQTPEFQAAVKAVRKVEEDVALGEKMESNTASESFYKRKAGCSALDEKTKEKRLKGQMEPEVKEKCSTETSENSSKDNSKASEVQKPDYIHVRARRGQATDSHSLAERARREKISKKMKCLQDLVPGCNKITGKAGMLDEIINYVQSLQRQVEFLSMKIATFNPSLAFGIDNSPGKEFPAYVANFPTAAHMPVMANLACLQLNSVQKEGPDAMMHSPQIITEGNASSSVSVLEQAFNSSYTSPLQPFLTWTADSRSHLSNGYSMGFHQGI